MLTRLQEEDSIISSWLFDSVWILYTVQIANWMWETKIPIITPGLGMLTIALVTNETREKYYKRYHITDDDTEWTSPMLILETPDDDCCHLRGPVEDIIIGRLWLRWHTDWARLSLSLSEPEPVSPLHSLHSRLSLPDIPFNWDSGAPTPATNSQHSHIREIKNLPDKLDNFWAYLTCILSIFRIIFAMTVYIHFIKKVRSLIIM